MDHEEDDRNRRPDFWRNVQGKGKGKGKGRAPSPPPEPEPEPEREYTGSGPSSVRAASAYNIARLEARVDEAMAAHAAAVAALMAAEEEERRVAKSAARTAKAKATREANAKRKAEAAAKALAERPQVVLPVERRVMRSQTREIRLSAFTGLLPEVFACIFACVPLSRFLMFCCTSRCFRDLFPVVTNFGDDNRKVQWLVEFDCLRVSMPFIHDFRPIWEHLNRVFPSNFERVMYIRRFHSMYFGDGLVGADGRPAPVVHFCDLFPGDVYHPRSLYTWLQRFSHAGPVLRLANLRFAGFFSTASTRQATIRILERTVNRFRNNHRIQPWLNMIRFLIRLTTESRGLIRVNVDSRQWGFFPGVGSIRQDMPLEFTVGVTREDYDRLMAEFIARYGANFMRPGWDFPFP